MRHESYCIARPHTALKNPTAYKGTPKRIVVRVKNKGLESVLRTTPRRGYLLRDRFQYSVDTSPFLSRTQNGQIRIQGKLGLDLFLNPIYICRRQIDLVDNRDNGEVMLHRRVKIGHSLSLNALGGINKE